MELIASTKSGKVRGLREDGVLAFRGIPYAAPPVGRLRFRPPERPQRWEGIRDATSLGPVAPQPLPPPWPPEFVELWGFRLEPQDEDCLSLNLWTPDLGGARLPVMVWIHGGGWVYGTGTEEFYNGTTFARDGVIVVTINYRLGALGFLHLAELLDDAPGSGNWGMFDQVAALEWVQENIAAFGGDPGNVTIFGESGGAMSVGTLLGSPRATGLFRRAIAQSGAAHFNLPSEVATRFARLFLKLVGVPPGDREALTAVPLERILDAQDRLYKIVRGEQATELLGETEADISDLAILPVIDGEFLPQRALEGVAAGVARDVDLLVGTNLDESRLMTVLGGEQLGYDEGALLSLMDALMASVGRTGGDALEAYRRGRAEASTLDLLAAMDTDRFFRIPAIRLAEAQCQHNASTYMYLFSWPTPIHGGRLGAFHGLEIPFVFDDLKGGLGRRMAGDDPPQDLATAMHGAWVSFATDGDPRHPAVPPWPRYDTARRATMEFGLPIRVVDDPYPQEELRLWEGVL